MKVCAVVVTYNRKKLLEECIDALLSQTYNLENIIIIDNNSTDGTSDMLSKKSILKNKKVYYYKLDENVGGAGGFHEGMKKSLDYNYDWVWVMDDDCIPKLNALEKLIESLEYVKDKNISFLCSKVLGPENEEMNIPQVSSKIGGNGYRTWMEYLDKSMVEVDNATFVSVLVRVDAINKVGLPWKEFFIWGDDIEYTMRLIKYYGPGYVVGKSIVLHKRIGAKNLSIIEEDNLQRLNMYKYRYRNDMILLEYKNSIEKVKALIAVFILIINVCLKSNKYTFKKVNIILSSIFKGLLNIKLKKSFRERMKK